MIKSVPHAGEGEFVSTFYREKYQTICGYILKFSQGNSLILMLASQTEFVLSSPYSPNKYLSGTTMSGIAIDVINKTLN